MNSLKRSKSIQKCFEAIFYLKELINNEAYRELFFQTKSSFRPSSFVIYLNYLEKQCDACCNY